MFVIVLRVVVSPSLRGWVQCPLPLPMQTKPGTHSRSSPHNLTLADPPQTGARYLCQAHQIHNLEESAVERDQIKRLGMGMDQEVMSQRSRSGTRWCLLSFRSLRL